MEAAVTGLAAWQPPWLWLGERRCRRCTPTMSPRERHSGQREERVPRSTGVQPSRIPLSKPGAANPAYCRTLAGSQLMRRDARHSTFSHAAARAGGTTIQGGGFARWWHSPGGAQMHGARPSVLHPLLRQGR